MELRINRIDDRWLVSCSITVGDGTTLFTSKINRFDVSETELEFYIPYRTGVKGEMYRGVLNGNTLEGVVEIGSATAPLHLTGTWSLQKNNGLDPKEPYMD